MPSKYGGVPVEDSGSKYGGVAVDDEPPPTGASILAKQGITGVTPPSAPKPNLQPSSAISRFGAGAYNASPLPALSDPMSAIRGLSHLAIPEDRSVSGIAKYLTEGGPAGVMAHGMVDPVVEGVQRGDYAGALGSGLTSAAQILAPETLGRIPEIANPVSKGLSVAGGAIKGAGQEAMAPVSYGMHNLRIPQSLAGGAAGHFAGSVLGHEGGMAGAAIGAGAPLVRGAIRGGREAAAAFDKAQGPPPEIPFRPAVPDVGAVPRSSGRPAPPEVQPIPPPPRNMPPAVPPATPPGIGRTPLSAQAGTQATTPNAPAEVQPIRSNFPSGRRIGGLTNQQPITAPAPSPAASPPAEPLRATPNLVDILRSQGGSTRNPADLANAQSVADAIARSSQAPGDSLEGQLRDSLANKSGTLIDPSRIEPAAGGEVPETIQEYRQKIRNGESIPPVETVYHPSTDKLNISDGFHRTAAYRAEGQQVPVTIQHVGNEPLPDWVKQAQGETPVSLNSYQQNIRSKGLTQAVQPENPGGTQQMDAVHERIAEREAAGQNARQGNRNALADRVVKMTEPDHPAPPPVNDDSMTAAQKTANETKWQQWVKRYVPGTSTSGNIETQKAITERWNQKHGEQ